MSLWEVRLLSFKHYKDRCPFREIIKISVFFLNKQFVDVYVLYITYIHVCVLISHEDNLAVILPTQISKHISAQTNPDDLLSVNISSILILVFLFPSQSLIADKLQDVRMILIITNPVKQHNKSDCLFEYFFYPEFLLYFFNGVFFLDFFKISLPEYDTFLNVIYIPILLHIVPISNCFYLY